MITVTYKRETNQTIVSVEKTTIDKSLFPLKIIFKNIVTNEIHFETFLQPHMWTSWVGAELITDILIYTSKGDLLHRWNWDVTEHGDEIEKLLWYYLLDRNNKGFRPNGLVIGSHDGRNGHWIYPVKKDITNVTLVDGSEKQYQMLEQNYKDYTNVKTKNTIVTTDGSDVTWYQGGEGYTDTIKPELIESWLNKNQITQISKGSISINELMLQKPYDWLHLDVEGIDAELILCLEQKPNVIIYENMNIGEDEKLKLADWFSENDYKTITAMGNTMAIKN